MSSNSRARVRVIMFVRADGGLGAARRSCSSHSFRGKTKTLSIKGYIHPPSLSSRGKEYEAKAGLLDKAKQQQCDRRPPNTPVRLRRWFRSMLVGADDSFLDKAVCVLCGKHTPKPD